MRFGKQIFGEVVNESLNNASKKINTGYKKMTINIGINGYGRIGRNILRALYESEKYSKLKIVAINDVGDNSVSAHLTMYDSAHGKFNKEVKADENFMYVGDDKININRIFSYRSNFRINTTPNVTSVHVETLGSIKNCNVKIFFTIVKSHSFFKFELSWIVFIQKFSHLFYMIFGIFVFRLYIKLM